jgi:hypothetical protein
LGGGVVIVPLLVLAFGIDLHYAAGASLISVIATSSGAAAAYVRQGYSNIRIGMVLEIATTIGAMVGAFLAAHTSTSAIGIVFGCVLIFSAAMGFRHHHDGDFTGPVDPWAARLRLDSDFPSGDGRQHYFVRRVPLGFLLMGFAGCLSGLLGIGSGAVKVLAMDQAMRLPFKVSTTTSDFMIGVTAAASAGVYLHRGYIDPVLSMPVVLGVLPGALVGAQILQRSNVGALRLVFAVVITALGLEMIYSGWTGKL